MKFKDALDFKDVIIEKELQKEIVPEIVFSCNHCKRPSGYSELVGIEQHLKQCLFRNENKRCLMCKNVKVIMEAQYPKNNKLWKLVDTEWAFGNYNTPYCMKKDIELTELEIHSDEHQDCFELDDGEMVYDKTEEYEQWMNLSTQLDEEWRVEEPTEE